MHPFMQLPIFKAGIDQDHLFVRVAHDAQVEQMELYFVLLADGDRLPRCVVT